MAEQENPPPPNSAKQSRERRTLKPVTAKRLENIALYHLERFPSSTANLHQVLMRRVRKAARFHDTDEEQAKEWITELIAKLTRMGLLNDASYAEAQARKLIRRGSSARAARAKLQAKGVDARTAAAALETVTEELGQDAERIAAEKYAQRRKLGPYRTTERTEESDQKDLGALGRAGFPYEIAKAVLTDR